MTKKNILIIIGIIGFFIIANLPIHYYESIRPSFYYEFEYGFIIGTDGEIPDAEILCVEIFYRMKTWEFVYAAIFEESHSYTLEWMEINIIEHFEWLERVNNNFEYNEFNKFGFEIDEFGELSYKDIKI
jgi:hypothetical protein